MLSISQKRQVILQNISKVSTLQNIRLIAVSKTFDINKILEAINDGQQDFGENYLQEALIKIQKIKQLAVPNIIWHYIGSIQSNKTNDIAQNFDWVHTVDREKIAKRLNDQRSNLLPKLNICIQVNIDNSPTKSGITCEKLLELASYITTLENINLRGIMAIPDKLNNDSVNLEAFEKMQVLYENLKQCIPDNTIDTLCMGMSDDYEQAIKYGANTVRIGTALFGQRDS